MATPRGCLIDGKKFMWDGKEYESKEDAEKAAGEYATEKFETRIVEENDTVHVYTRRVVAGLLIASAPARAASQSALSRGTAQESDHKANAAPPPGRAAWPAPATGDPQHAACAAPSGIPPAAAQARQVTLYFVS